MEEQIEKLTEQKNQMLEELETMKRRFELEDIQKQEKERKVYGVQRDSVGTARDGSQAPEGVDDDPAG